MRRLLLMIVCVLIALFSSFGYPTKTLMFNAATDQSVVLRASRSQFTLPCDNGVKSKKCPLLTKPIDLKTRVNGFKKGKIYQYSVTGGRLTGEGASVKWDLSRNVPGTYTATVEVRDSEGNSGDDFTTVSIEPCPDCIPPNIQCPTISVSCSPEVRQGASAVFAVSVLGQGRIRPTYNWSVSSGSIGQGQGKSSITVNTTGLANQTITATVALGGGFSPECQSIASCSTSVVR